MKQKFERSCEILEYSLRAVGKEVGQGQEGYCSVPLMTQFRL